MDAAGASAPADPEAGKQTKTLNTQSDRENRFCQLVIVDVSNSKRL